VRFRIAVLWAMAMLTARVGSAQYNTAEIDGVVFDAQGGVLPGASVVAVHAASGQRFERVSDDRGRFFLPALPVGEYTLSAALEGFRQTTERRVVLLVGQKVSVRVVLQLGERTETVTVTAVSPFLQTTTSEVADVISNRQVVQLPLNGRQFLQLAGTCSPSPPTARSAATP